MTLTHPEPVKWIIIRKDTPGAFRQPTYIVRSTCALLRKIFRTAEVQVCGRVVNK